MQTSFKDVKSLYVNFLVVLSLNSVINVTVSEINL